MPSEYTALPPEFMQAHPALSLLRLAALSAGPDSMLDDDTLELMFEQVETGALTLIAPSDMWPELERGLMANTPSNMFRALFASGALAEVLPEVLAVFGVPQIADNPPEVDIGQHLLRVLDEAARCGPRRRRPCGRSCNAGSWHARPRACSPRCACRARSARCCRKSRRCLACRSWAPISAASTSVCTP